MSAVLTAIRDTPLSVDECLAYVSRPDAGGTVVFVGTVRDHDEDRDVVELEYSAHPSALALLESVAAGVAADYPGTVLAAVHRVGSLRIGDLAVVVAASAAHRGEAFAAARELIDRLKAEVPIWKRQVFAGGGVEWVGSP